MKLIGIVIGRVVPDTDVRIMSEAFDLSSFGFFQRGSVREWAIFFSKTLLARSAVGVCQSVAHEDHMCHIYNHENGSGAVLISDAEYPMVVAFSIIRTVLDEFALMYQESWDTLEQEAMPYPELESHLAKYQDPQEADSVMKIQQDLDETKIILHEAIEELLERGEKLDVLVEESADLSTTSKVFYQQAADKNACCVIL